MMMSVSSTSITVTPSRSARTQTAHTTASAKKVSQAMDSTVRYVVQLGVLLMKTISFEGYQ